MSTCFICCSTPKHARVHVFFTNKSTKEIPTRRHGAHRSPFSLALNRFLCFYIPFLLLCLSAPFSVCVCVCFFFFFFNFSVTSRHRRKISFRAWKNMKDGWVEEYDCISTVLFEIQMDDGNTERENRRYTFADFVVAANYLHKQISTETNSTRQEYFAVPTMQSSLVQSDSSNPFSLTSPLSFWHIMISGLLR